MIFKICAEMLASVTALQSYKHRRLSAVQVQAQVQVQASPVQIETEQF